MAVERTRSVAESALHALSQGSDVLLRGERGAGKSTHLAQILARLSRSGVAGVLISAAGDEDLDAFLSHPSIPSRAMDGRTLTAWLHDELRVGASALLLDDLDRMDTASLRVVARVLRATSCQLVATTSIDPLRTTSRAMREILVERAPTEFRVPHLDLAAVSAILVKVLGGPADTRLTSAVMTQAGGNPRAVTVLARAALMSGAVRLADGLWIEDGSLEEVPVEALLLAFLPALEPELVTGVEILACSGPVPVEVAQRMIDPAVLDALINSGRVVSHEFSDSGQVLGVSPPALARAVRDHIGPYQRQRLLRRLETRLDKVGSAAMLTGVSADRMLSPTVDEGDASSARVAALVHERAASLEAVQRSAWETERTLANANAYLDTLMQRPQENLVEAVFAETHVSATDPVEERFALAYREARWAQWCGATPAQVRARVAQRLGHDVVLVGLDDLKEGIVRSLRDGAAPEQFVKASQSESDIPQVRALSAVIRTSALLESGSPLQAIACATGDGSLGIDPEADRHLSALTAESMAMLGRMGDAERQERDLLQQAYDDADVLGIRVHACVLAEVLYLSGQGAEAWRTLSAALRLGAAGPLESPFYRRGLTVGAILQAHAGNYALARILLRELDNVPQLYRPLIRSLRSTAQVALSSAMGDIATSTQVAWHAGLRYAEDGLVQPAMVAWMGMPPTLTRSQTTIVREVCERVSIPFLDPYMRLHLAIADGDDDAAAEALEHTNASVAPTLVRAASRLLGRRVGRKRPTDRGPAQPGDDLPLSPREREIAALAREGMGNPAIAKLLSLSVRTVENHMSKVLRKLQLSSRTELAGYTGLVPPLDGRAAAR